LRDSLPIDMLLSALSFLVVAQSSSEIPEGLMNNSVFITLLLRLMRHVHLTLLHLIVLKIHVEEN